MKHTEHAQSEENRKEKSENLPWVSVGSLESKNTSWLIFLLLLAPGPGPLMLLITLMLLVLILWWSWSSDAPGIRCLLLKGNVSPLTCLHQRWHRQALHQWRQSKLPTIESVYVYGSVNYRLIDYCIVIKKSHSSPSRTTYQIFVRKLYYGFYIFQFGIPSSA